MHRGIGGRKRNQPWYYDGEQAGADLGTVFDGGSCLCCRPFEFLDETVVDVRGMLFFKLVLHKDRHDGRTIDGIGRAIESGVGSC